MTLATPITPTNHPEHPQTSACFGMHSVTSSWSVHVTSTAEHAGSGEKRCGCGWLKPEGHSLCPSCDGRR
ncbi:hypothetical protein M8445_17395 (plasmid) [Deinococcus aquaticus]|uniref:Uncharacterized protein n=1 Tax=Deinococcus aquaticus TaxID=328692 RepID=A0ABY7V8F3_9DEIO|nr:hypothetical protein [Deinococcus aquaticus]WDA60743.1 hypothetical protein M8445_17395 [Deinococcus aquaticus]